MIHDPQCPEGKWFGKQYPPDRCPVCRLIRAVREDEQRGMELTHAAIHRRGALRQAHDAIAALLIDPPRCASDHTWNNAIRRALTAVEKVEAADA